MAGRGVRARVRLGHRLVILDMSPRGALVDARRDMIAARVLRCGVIAIDPESGVTYRAALSFNESCEWVREAATHRGYGLPASDGVGTSGNGDELPVLGCWNTND